MLHFRWDIETGIAGCFSRSFGSSMEHDAVTGLPQEVKSNDKNNPKGETDEKHDAKNAMPWPAWSNEGEEHKAGWRPACRGPQEPTHGGARVMVMKEVCNSSAEV
jgi:hypothetical protein